MKSIALVIATVVMALGSLAGCDGGLSIRVTESIGVDDSPQASSAPVIRVVETISATDSLQVPTSGVIRVAETVGVADSAWFFPSIVIHLVETIHVSDSPTLASTQVQPTPLPPSTAQVTVVSPKAGAVWRVGTAQDIAWTTTGEGISYVGIYYSIDAGKSMYAIAQKESNDGIYTWKVPNTPSKTVLVRVLAYNANGATLALGDSQLLTISVQ